MARGGRDAGVRRHFGVHRIVGAPIRPRQGGCRGAHGRHRLEIRLAARRGVRIRRRPAQVRRRRVAPALLRRRPCCASSPGGIRDASHVADDRPREHGRGVGHAEDARRNSLRHVPLLPRRRHAPGADRRRRRSDRDGRHGGGLRRRRDPDQSRRRGNARRALCRFGIGAGSAAALEARSHVGAAVARRSRGRPAGARDSHGPSHATARGGPTRGRAPPVRGRLHPLRRRRRVDRTDRPGCSCRDPGRVGVYRPARRRRPRRHVPPERRRSRRRQVHPPRRCTADARGQRGAAASHGARDRRCGSAVGAACRRQPRPHLRRPGRLPVSEDLYGDGRHDGARGAIDGPRGRRRDPRRSGGVRAVARPLRCSGAGTVHRKGHQRAGPRLCIGEASRAASVGGAAARSVRRP